MHIDIMYRPTSKWTQEELKKLQGKWFVKKLSGELKGCATFYDNKELAQMEARHVMNLNTNMMLWIIMVKMVGN